MSRHYQKITAPIHRSTAYDFNVQLDHVSLNKENNTIMTYTPDVEKLGVKEHEILVRYVDSQHRYKDNRLRVFSALNNLIYSEKMLLDLFEDAPSCWGPNVGAGAPDTDKRRAAKNTIQDLLKGSQTDDGGACGESLNRVLHKHLCYVGVAITPQNLYPRHSRQDSQGFACSRGGLNTIINTGSKRIMPGQKIRIDFALPDHVGGQRFVSPSHYSKGTPHNKMLVQTHPVDEFRTSDAFLHRILDSMHHLKTPKDNNDPMQFCYAPLTMACVPATNMPFVFFLRKDSDATMDLDTVDASRMHNGVGQAVNFIDRQQAGRDGKDARLIRFHAETTEEFKAKAQSFIDSIPQNQIPGRPQLTFVCFRTRHVSGRFNVVTRELDAIDDGVIVYQKQANSTNFAILQDTTINGREMSMQDFTNFVLRPGIGVTITFTKPAPQTEAVLQTRERMQIATSKNKNSVEAAVAVASRAGDTLHYALSVMKRANYKGYLGAKTPLAEFVRDIVKTTLRVMQSENEQTIGVALSGANQGEPFDICLTDH